MSNTNGYARPDVLVSAEWVSAHLDDPTLRLVESNEDVLLYDTGHIPGAVNIDWHNDLNDALVRDYIDSAHFAALLSRHGITPETTVIFYGDKNNWWAAYAFWVFQLFGHKNAKVMDGGRVKWSAESRPLTREVPSYPASDYVAAERNDKPIRALRDDVLVHIAAGRPLVDVRSPAEYKGELLHMAAQCYELSELGYVGVDFVLDKNKGPLILELNARPGLAIQIANGNGLLHRLRKVEALKDAGQLSPNPSERVAFARAEFPTL